MPSQIWQKFQYLSAFVGILLCLALIFFVQPESVSHPDREVLQLWRVTGAAKEPPVWEWYNESQDEIFANKVGLPFFEIEQKFLTASVGNVPPDVFEYFGSVPQWSTRGALMPLDEFMERDNFDREKIFGSLWEEMQWDGKTFAIPVGTANEAFFWNKEHFREAGLDPDRPPQTWQELEEYALKLTKQNADGEIVQAGFIPGYWSASPTPLFLVWQIQNGATFLSEDGKTVTLATEENIEAIEWQKELFEKLGDEKLVRMRASFGYGSQHGFLSGKVSMIQNKSTFPDDISKFADGLEYSVAPFPVPKGGKKATLSGPLWIGIPSGAKNPEAAWDYIKFYTSEATQERWAQYAADNNLADFFPANIEAATSPEQLARPHMDTFTESMQWAHTSNVVPMAHTVFWREMTSAWDRTIRGDATAKEALEEAERAVQKALDDQIDYNLFYRDHLREEQSI